MTKQEFLEALGRKLAEGLPQGEVYRQMQYYEGYIDAEMRRGRTEEEVIAELGDPLLLARNVLGSPVSATAVWNEVSPYEQGCAEGSYESRFAPKEEEKVPVYGSSGFPEGGICRTERGRQGGRGSLPCEERWRTEKRRRRGICRERGNSGWTLA